MTTGRNFNEILRVLDSIQLSTKKVATPANWNQNEDVIIIPAVSDEEATELFGDYKKVKPYLPPKRLSRLIRASFRTIFYVNPISFPFFSPFKWSTTNYTNF